MNAHGGRRSRAPGIFIAGLAGASLILSGTAHAVTTTTEDANSFALAVANSSSGAFFFDYDCVADDTTTTDMTFTVPGADFERAKALLAEHREEIGYTVLQGTDDVVKVSAIGIGMRSHAGVAARAFRALSEKGINIRAITTSEIKFSVLIDSAYTELAVRTLHTLYGLDKA